MAEHGDIVKELFVTLGLDTDSAAFASAQVAVGLLEKGLHLLVEGFEKVLDVLKETVFGTAEYAHNLEVTAQTLGLSTAALEGFQYAAKVSGVSAEALSTSIGRLSRAAYESTQGGEAQSKAFRDLGVSVRDSNGHLKPTSELLTGIADKFAVLPDGPKKIALAMEVLGRGGKELIPLLNRGSEGISALVQDFDELGGAMSEADVQSGTRLQGSLYRLQSAFQIIQHQIAGPVLDSVREIVDGMVEWVKANRAWLVADIRSVLRAVVSIAKVGFAAFKGLAAGVKFVLDNWRVLTAFLAGTGLGVLLLNLGTVSALAGAWTAAGAAALASAAKAAAAWLAVAWPIVALGVVLAGVYLLLQDIWGYFNGLDSFTGRLQARFADWAADTSSGPAWLRWLKEGVKAAREFNGWLDSLGESKLALFGKFASAVGGPVGGLGFAAQGAEAAFGGGASPAASAPSLVGSSSSTVSTANNTTVNVHLQEGVSAEDAGRLVTHHIKHERDRVHREAHAALSDGG